MPTSTLHEIATFSTQPNESKPIAEYVSNLLRSPGAEWRRIEKALHLFEFLLLNGSSSLITELEAKSAEVKYLCDFVYTNEGPDRGESSKG